MAAGLFGVLGFDMVRLVERLPDANRDPLGLADAMLMRPGWWRSSTRSPRRSCWSDRPPERGKTVAAREARAAAEARLGGLAEALARPCRRAPPSPPKGDGTELVSPVDRADYGAHRRTRQEPTFATGTSFRWCPAIA